ncbi:hypothetical protein Tco_1258674 [Tanacetum coccineum]
MEFRCRSSQIEMGDLLRGFGKRCRKYIMRECVIDFGGSYHSSIRCALFEALYGRKFRSPVLWAKIGESSLIGLELVQETTDKVVLVTPWKGVVRFGKKDEIKVNKTLHFIEEPIEIIDREIKKLKHRKIALVKVRWNSKCGPEFTWEHEDQMRIRYPQLFVDRVIEPATKILGRDFLKEGIL